MTDLESTLAVTLGSEMVCECVYVHMCLSVCVYLYVMVKAKATFFPNTCLYQTLLAIMFC